MQPTSRAVALTRAFRRRRVQAGIRAITPRPWVERPLAGPYEMRPVGGFEACVAALAQAQPSLGAFAVSVVHRRRGLEVEIVGVEAQDSQ
jgi:hypothetical protein